MTRATREAFTYLSMASSTSFSSTQSSSESGAITTPSNNATTPNNDDENTEQHHHDPAIGTTKSNIETSSSSTSSPHDPVTEAILLTEKANHSAVVPHMSMFITLTPEEEELFQTLENAAIAYENHTLPLLSELEGNQNNEANSNANNQNSGDGKEDPRAKKNGDMEIIMPDIPPERIEIRVAGGWVRDKLLHLCSNDIDLALDSLSGLQYASVVQRYLLHQEQQSQKSQKEHDMDHVEPSGNSIKKGKKNKTTNKPKIAVIAANPDQSKHLETATMRIHSIDVDFVHLRGGETYSSDSRIPTLKENATPLDDALRRDFTVNALFYNLRKREVEDYTGRGIQDLLVNKSLVTPIDANLTFHDDPLRVLRAIRFGVRYGLTLSDEIVKAARSKEVHDSLHLKVSRERVGKELEGMLSGKHAKPEKALELMTILRLAGCVFCFPPHGLPIFGAIGDDNNEYSHYLNHDKTSSDDVNMDVAAANARRIGWEEAASLLKYTRPLLDVFAERLAAVGNSLPLSERVNTRLFYLSSFLYPFRKLTYLDKKNKSYLLTTYMIKESIKFANKDVASITTIMENVDEVRSILSGYFHRKDTNGDRTEVVSSFCRLRIGLVLRRLKDLWITTLLVAAIAELRSNNLGEMDIDEVNDENKQGEGNVKFFCKTISFVFNLYQDILSNNLDECWKLRPLLDGKAIVKSLDLPRGPAVGTYLEEQMKWMLEHPDGSKNECEEHLRSMRKRELELSSSEGGENISDQTKKKNTIDEKVRHCAKKAHTEN